MMLTHESTLSIDNVEPSSVQIIQVIIAHLFGPQSRGRHLRRTVLALVLNFFQEPKRFNLTDKYLWTPKPWMSIKMDRFSVSLTFISRTETI